MNTPTATYTPNAPASGLLRSTKCTNRLHKPFLGRQAVPESGGASTSSAGHARRAQLSVAASASPPRTQVRRLASRAGGKAAA